MFNRLLLTVALVLGSSLSAETIEISSVEQYNNLKKGTLITMFTASWCGPCKQVKPHFKALSDEFSDVTFCLVDVDTFKEIDPTVQSMPTFVITHKGTERERVTGALPKHKLRQFIANNRAAALGEIYKEERVTLLTANEYYKNGLARYKTVVEELSKKDISLTDIDTIVTNHDEAYQLLIEACQQPDTSAEAFELYKSYMRGCMKSLSGYKPHQKTPDAVVTYLRNLCKFALSADSYAEVTAHQQSVMKLYGEKVQKIVQEVIQESVWPTLAELSAN